MAQTADPILARRLLDQALAGNPTLTVAQVDDLFAFTATVDADGTTVYTGTLLNAAAASGWDQKANLTADQYEVGVGSGKTFKRSEWRNYCRARAFDYRAGSAQVLPTQRSGSGAVQLTTVLTDTTV